MQSTALPGCCPANQGSLLTLLPLVLPSAALPQLAGCPAPALCVSRAADMSTDDRSQVLILPDLLAVSTQVPPGWMACAFSRQ
jgi:hypothetical protein